MALQKNITLIDNFNEEVDFNDAYIKVENVTGDKLEGFCMVGIYKSNGGQILKKERHPFTPDMEGDNFIKQAYVALKAGPFSGASDV